MNRRQLLQTLIGGGLTLALNNRNSAVAVPQTIDMISGASSEIPFRSASPSYLFKGFQERFVWTLGTVRSPRKVLFQAAVQQPAYFFVFRYENNSGIALITQGKTTPRYLWATSSRNKSVKVNYVSEYLDLPAGTYVFMGQDETSPTAPNNECSMSMRDPTVPGQQLSYRFVESTPLVGIGAENTVTPFGPFQVLGNPPSEVYYLKGCVNESIGGQTVEVLHEPQFLLWKQKKPYTPTFTFAHHFHTQNMAAALNSKWYLLLKNPGPNPSVSTNNPVSLSYVFERWQRAP